MARWPSTAKIFLKPDGSLIARGDALVQTDLADTLDAIAKRRPARVLRRADRRQDRRRGARRRRPDDARRPEELPAVERVPVRGTYRGYDIVSMPPPSSGGVVLIEMLNILEGYLDLARRRRAADCI